MNAQHRQFGTFGCCSEVLAFGLLVAATCGAAANSTLDKARQIDELVSRYQHCGYLNGAVLVAQHGRVIYAKGVGEADIGSHIPNTPRTKFGIASLTKQFTAALVLQQAAAGKLRLDGTITEYLPWYRKDAGSRMSIDQLLHHTTGLPADYDWPEFSAAVEAQQHFDAETFAKKFCQPALVAEPGTKWAYSNCGYILLGLILEQVTGESFADLLQKQILDPLGMKATGMDRNDLKELGGAVGYTRHAGPRYSPGPYLDRDHVFAAGAMYSSVEDLFRWNQALSTNNLFPAGLRQQMFNPAINQWACGWFVSKIPAGRPGAGNTLAEMRGDMPGNFFAWILRYPEQDGVVIVLRNAYGSTEHFEENLQAILFDQPPHLPGRSPKDIVAHLFLTSYASFANYRTLGLLAFALVIAVLRQMANRKRTARMVPA